jgi:hypothetical protein
MHWHAYLSTATLPLPGMQSAFEHRLKLREDISPAPNAFSGATTSVIHAPKVTARKHGYAAMIQSGDGLPARNSAISHTLWL